MIDPGYRRLGYLLGRWAYLADAADDRARDLRRGHFNAFAAAGSDPARALQATAAELARTMESIEFTQFGVIAANIIIPGLAAVQASILRKDGQEP